MSTKKELNITPRSRKLIANWFPTDDQIYGDLERESALALRQKRIDDIFAGLRAYVNASIERKRYER